MKVKKKMENVIEEVKTFCLGKENLVKVIIYGKNIKSSRPSYSFKLKFSDGNFLIWDDCSENCGGFEYASQEDAIDAALDFLVDHASFHKINKKDLKKEEDFYNENPENNMEEIPEDFRLDMKK